MARLTIRPGITGPILPGILATWRLVSVAVLQQP